MQSEKQIMNKTNFFVVMDALYYGIENFMDWASDTWTN
jgi:hypothetical protein